MKKYILLALLVLCASPAFAKSPAWKEGKLLLSASAASDGYRTYKIVLLMGDQAAKLWNHAGKFDLQSSDPRECPSCTVAQGLIDSMLQDCRKTPADFCQHQVPIRYHLDACTVDHIPCLAVDFPLDPRKGLEGKHKTAWMVVAIRPAAEVAADSFETCIASRSYDCLSGR